MDKYKMVVVTDLNQVLFGSSVYRFSDGTLRTFTWNILKTPEEVQHRKIESAETQHDTNETVQHN
jgi:hypothetical protein